VAQYRYTFIGVVHPERAAVSIGPVVWSLEADHAGISGTLTVSINVSQISAVFDSSQKVQDPFTLKNYIDDAVRVIVDAFGYIKGCGYDVEIVQMVGPKDEEGPIVFGVGIPALEGRQADSTALLKLVAIYKDRRGSYLQRCLSDFREAIRSPRDTGFFCYRAVESLRQFFVAEGASNNGESWKQLREAVNVDRDEIDFIKQFADPVRHGGDKAVTGVEREDLFRKTVKIIDGFIAFAERGYCISAAADTRDDSKGGKY